MGELDLMWKLIAAIPVAIPNARPFRRAIINAETKAGWRAVAGIKGQCDLVVYFRGGRVLEVETKARRGVLSARQYAWQKFCHALEIPHLVLTEKAMESPEETIARWLAEILTLSQAQA